MSVLEGIWPEEVMGYFEEISQIPHGSFNTKEISDYLANFAKERNLKYIQDEYNNVIIFKDGSKGYENSSPVIIQGHMDMVFVKEEWVTSDVLSLKTDGKEIYAEGTSLGGDDGVALAYALAILDSDTIAHPPLECIFTSDEEVGMLGAIDMDVSMLKGKTLLNVDSQQEGIFLTGCAGGVDADCIVNISRSEIEGYVYEIAVGGLKGGHSGLDIGKHIKNANVLLAKRLDKLRQVTDFNIIDIAGGDKINSIPKQCVAHIVTD